MFIMPYTPFILFDIPLVAIYPLKMERKKVSRAYDTVMGSLLQGQEYRSQFQLTKFKGCGYSGHFLVTRDGVLC